MVEVRVIIITVILTLLLLGLFGVVLFTIKNNFAKKITKRVMKNQGIFCARTMKDVDERLDEMVKKDDRKKKQIQ